MQHINNDNNRQIIEIHPRNENKEKKWNKSHSNTRGNAKMAYNVKVLLQLKQTCHVL